MISFNMPMWTAYLIGFWIIVYSLRTLADLFIKFDLLKSYFKYFYRKYKKDNAKG
jgi:hypothetical protein